MAPVESRLFEKETIAYEQLILAVPTSFPLFESETRQDGIYPVISEECINNKPFVMLTDTQYMQLRLEELANKNGLSLKKAVVVKSLEAQIAMVRAGVGMALVTSGIEKFCARGEVNFYSFENQLPQREIVLIYPKDKQLTRAGNDLKEIIKNTKW